MENYLDLGSESETYIQNKGQYQTSINGKVVDNTKWKVAYDGDELDLEAKRNNEAVYMKLDKYPDRNSRNSQTNQNILRNQKRREKQKRRKKTVNHLEEKVKVKAKNIHEANIIHEAKTNITKYLQLHLII